MIDAWHSGKTHDFGGNIQAVMRRDGFPIWVSDVEPGLVHDLTAAHQHVLGALYAASSQLHLPTLDDGGCDGAGIGVHTPVKQPADGIELDVNANDPGEDRGQGHLTVPRRGVAWQTWRNAFQAMHPSQLGSRGVMNRIGHYFVRATLLAALIVTSAAAAPAQPDAGSADAVLVETDSVVITRDGEWIRYNHADELGSSTERIYKGSRDSDGGCTFSGEETVGPSRPDEVIEEREIATNLSDCTTITEIGIQSAPDERQDGMASETEHAADRGNVDDGGVGIMATTGAWHRTYFTDPPGIAVTSARTNVRWTYSGGCVTSSSNHVTNYNWLSGTGWQKLQSSTTSARICSYARTTSDSYFANLVFCPPVTGTDYIPNRLRGRSNGSYDMHWTWRKHGSCTGLLTFRRQHGRA